MSFSGKARIIKIAEDMNAVVDSLTACKFIFFAASLEEYARIYRAVTGVHASARRGTAITPSGGLDRQGLPTEVKARELGLLWKR